MSVLFRLRQVSDVVNQLAIVVCVGCVVVMLGISVTAFAYKLWTGSALSWTYSLARLFLPWIGFLSMTISLRYGEHVAMTLFVRSLPGWMVRAAATLCLVILGVFSLLLIWYGWSFFLNATQIYLVSDTIRVSYRFTTVAVPISGIIMLLHLVHGFGLLEHFIEDDELIDELIESTDLEES